MKRAKHPPLPDLVGECAALHDMLTEGVDRRDDFERENPLRLRQIMSLAISEYLRRFPARRKNNSVGWVQRWDYPNKETHYDCMFCRADVVTTPVARPLTTYLMQKLDRHAEKCAVAMLAGLMTPVNKADEQYVVLLGGEMRLPGVFATQMKASVAIRKHRMAATPARPLTDYEILAI